MGWGATGSIKNAVSRRGGGGGGIGGGGSIGGGGGGGGSGSVFNETEVLDPKPYRCMGVLREDGRRRGGRGCKGVVEGLWREGGERVERGWSGGRSAGRGGWVGGEVGLRWWGWAIP